MKNFTALGAVLGFLSVALGAMAAHALKEVLTAEEIASFQTGTRYLMYHSIVLLILGLLGSEKFVVAAKLFFAGSILFSFSIFFIHFFKLAGLPYRWLGPVTPLGGLLLMAGWGMLFIRSVKK